MCGRWFVWLPPQRAKGKGPIRWRGSSRPYELPLSWLDNWFKQQYLQCKHLKCVVPSSPPKMFPTHVSGSSATHSKPSHFPGIKGSLPNILWDYTCISDYMMWLHMYSLSCDWIYTHNRRKTAAFCYDVSYVHFCGCGIVGYLELLLPQADAKGDINQIWPKSQSHHMAGGDHWKTAGSMLWQRLLFPKVGLGPRGRG